MTLNTVPDLRQFPRVQRILTTPGVLAVSVMAATEVALASNPTIRSQLIQADTYAATMLGLVFCAKCEAHGRSSGLPVLAGVHPEIVLTFLDMLGWLYRPADSDTPNPQQASDQDSCEMWFFVNCMLARHGLHRYWAGGPRTSAQRVRSGLTAMAGQGNFSTNGPILFWNLLEDRTARKQLCLRGELADRVAVVAQAIKTGPTTPQGSPFDQYAHEGRGRLGQPLA